MKAMLITNKGIEESARKELKELISVEADANETLLEFTPKSMEDLCRLCYFSQSASRIAILLKYQAITSVNDIALDIDLRPYLNSAKTFNVECVRHGTHDFKSVDIEKKIIAIVASYNLSFTHKNADIAFFAYVYGSNFYFGIDLSGFDLSKRSYKIYSLPNSLKGPVGYTLVRECGYGSKDNMVITSSKDGIVPIEAAFFASGMSVNFFNKAKFIFQKYKFLELPRDFLDRLDSEPKKINVSALDSSNHNITLTKKNARIAGVEKMLKFSRVDLEWLDTKFHESSADRIIGHLPSVSKHRSENDIKKVYREFFNQAYYIIKPKGAILTLTQKTDLLKEAAGEYKLKLKKEKTVEQGQSLFYITLFGK